MRCTTKKLETVHILCQLTCSFVHYCDDSVVIYDWSFKTGSQRLHWSTNKATYKITIVAQKFRKIKKSSLFALWENFWNKTILTSIKILTLLWAIKCTKTDFWVPKTNVRIRLMMSQGLEKILTVQTFAGPIYNHSNLIIKHHNTTEKH